MALSLIVLLVHRILYSEYRCSYGFYKRMGRLAYRLFARSPRVRMLCERKWGKTLEQIYLCDLGATDYKVLRGRAPAYLRRGIAVLLGALSLALVSIVHVLILSVWGSQRTNRFIFSPSYFGLFIGLVFVLSISLERVLYKEEACTRSFHEFSRESKAERSKWRWRVRLLVLGIILLSVGGVIFLAMSYSCL